MTLATGYVVKCQCICSIKKQKRNKEILYKLITPNLCDSHICKFYINMIL